MSVDWYLYSPSRRVEVNVGSVGLGGIQSYPGLPEVVEFIRWTIENHITDIVLIDEHRWSSMEDDADLAGVVRTNQL